MRGRSGAGRIQRSDEDGDPALGRWVSLSLVVLLHAGLYLLLRNAGESMPPPTRKNETRIRLVWSVREPATPAQVPPPVVKIPAPRPAAVVVRDPLPRARADTAPPSKPVLHTDQDDAWSFEAAPAVGDDHGVGAGFRRDVFERSGRDAFAPPGHLPGLRMRDASFGGWLQSEARRRACADLRGALSSRPESAAAIMSSMQRWECGS